MIRAYKRLTVSAKLSIAALAMLIPMLTLAYFMEISFRYDIRIGQTELAGTQYLREAFRLQHLLIEHRTRQLLEAVPQDARSGLELEVMNPSLEISQTLNHLAGAVDNELADGPEHATNTLKCVGIERMRESWTWYESTGRNVAFDDAAAAALELIVQVGNCANLALDPALDSQMLGRAVSVLPEGSNLMSRLQWLAMEMLADDSIVLSSSQRDILIAQSALFRDGLLKRILADSQIAMVADANYYTYSPTLTMHYGNSLNYYRKMSEQLLEVITRLQLGQAHPSELFNSANRVRAAGHSLYGSAMNELDILIQKRIDGYQTWRVWGTALGVAGVILAFLLLAAASRSITRGILSVMGFTRDLAQGNYDAVVNMDDLGPHMRSMIAGTDEMVGELKEKMGYLNGILHGLTAPCFVVDREERFTYINQQFLDLFEHEDKIEDLIGEDLATKAYGDPDYQTLSGKCMRKGAPITNESVVYKTPKGNIRYARFDAAPLYDLDNKLIGAFGLVTDMTKITEQKEAIERLAAFPREAPNPVLSAGEDGRILYMNNAASDVFDDTAVAPDQNFLPEGHAEIVSSCLTSGTSRYGIESSIGNNSYSWTYHPLPSQQIVHMYASDITKRVMVEKQMLHDAFHDKLTGLPNKALFLDRVNQTFRRARRRDIKFAILFFDLDGFKNINDSLGHGAGDKLLTQFAWRTKKLIGPDETLARLGGDEFTLLMPIVNDDEHAVRMADTIQKDLGKPFEIDGHELFVSASIGVINAPDGANDAGELLRDAETAMYHAKASGRARWEVFNPTMHEDASERLKMENDLQKAVENGEFEPYFQPIICQERGQITGFEALIRWNHPEQGLVSPARFIPLAEETGLIVPMGAFMLEAACKQVKAWQDLFPAHRNLSISVNMSVEQMTRETIGGEVRSILEHVGISLSTVRIEVTESGLMDNVGSAVELLKELESMGVSLMIDDFGTGYSSLSHLHQFPFHYLKIDQSFVSSMEDNSDNMEIVRTIVSLAHTLGKQVVAEGVETESQHALLKGLQCEMMQGYHFSRPLPAAAAEELLARNPKW